MILSINPETTLGEVFDRSYERIDELVEGLCEGENVSAGLVFDFPKELKAARGVKRTAKLAAANGSANRLLIARTKLVEPESDQKTPIPIKASAFRRDEEPERASANFVLSKGPSGIITCRLGYVGVSGERLAEEPVGTTSERPEVVLGDLDNTDQMRISAVSQAIARNAGVVESMISGSSLEEALAQAGAAAHHS